MYCFWIPEKYDFKTCKRTAEMYKINILELDYTNLQFKLKTNVFYVIIIFLMFKFIFVIYKLNFLIFNNVLNKTLLA